MSMSLIAVVSFTILLYLYKEIIGNNNKNTHIPINCFCKQKNKLACSHHTAEDIHYQKQTCCEEMSVIGRCGTINMSNMFLAESPCFNNYFDYDGFRLGFRWI